MILYPIGTAAVHWLYQASGVLRTERKSLSSLRLVFYSRHRARNVETPAWARIQQLGNPSTHILGSTTQTATRFGRYAFGQGRHPTVLGSPPGSWPGSGVRNSFAFTCCHASLLDIFNQPEGRRRGSHWGPTVSSPFFLYISQLMGRISRGFSACIHGSFVMSNLHLNHGVKSVMMSFLHLLFLLYSPARPVSGAAFLSIFRRVHILVSFLMVRAFPGFVVGGRRIRLEAVGGVNTCRT
jgi:hypothetical protein